MAPKDVAQMSDEEAKNILNGLSRQSWAGKVCLKEPLRELDGSYIEGTEPKWRYIEGTYPYPPTPGQQPVPTTILSVDLGKSALKIGGVNWKADFIPTIIPNAYCKARAVQFEAKAGDDRTIHNWRLLEPAPVPTEDGSPVEPEQFWINEEAKKYADELPILADSFIRLRQQRMKNFVYAGLVTALKDIGMEATTFALGAHNESHEVPKVHYLAIVLGLPYMDVVGMNDETKAAIKSLYGPATVECHDIRADKTERWHLHISVIYPVAQSKGTQVATCNKLNGDPATDKEDIVEIDGGAGDIHVLRFNISGALQTIGDRVGDGSVELATEVQQQVFKKHRIKLTIPQAQEALRTRTIRKSGSAFTIDPIIQGMDTRFDNLVQRLMPSDDMRDSLLIYTGGIAALLAERLHDSLKNMKLTPGVDYLVVPGAIAAIVNALGLFAYGFYRIRDEVYQWVEYYYDLLDQYETDRAGLALFMERNSGARAEILERQHELQRAYEALANHVGQYYPDVKEQVEADRVAAQ